MDGVITRTSEYHKTGKFLRGVDSPIQVLHLDTCLQFKMQMILSSIRVPALVPSRELDINVAMLGKLRGPKPCLSNPPTHCIDHVSSESSPRPIGASMILSSSIVSHEGDLFGEDTP